MALLSVGYYTLEYDGSVVTCSRDGSVLGTVSVSGGSTELDFGVINFCLNSEEWDALLGRAGEAVEEAPVVAEEETPVVPKKRRRS